jgi:hypothetical protein
MDIRVKNLIGLRFGRLVVVGFADSIRGDARWKCKCDCGQESTVFAQNLKRGTTKSCGCMAIKHGECRRNYMSPEYQAYKAAKARCAWVNHPHADRYRGRGIEFRFKSFAEFLSCIGRKPEDKTDLDRINNDGHYEPGNVRWATGSENCRNYTITPELSMIRAANMRKAQKLRWANHGL